MIKLQEVEALDDGLLVAYFLPFFLSLVAGIEPYVCRAGNEMEKSWN